MRLAAIRDVPGQPTTTRAPSTHCSGSASWLSRLVNSTTWDVSKSRMPSLSMAIAPKDGRAAGLVPAEAPVQYTRSNGADRRGQAPPLVNPYNSLHHATRLLRRFGCFANRERKGDQERLSQAGQAISPRPQPWRQG